MVYGVLMTTTNTTTAPTYGELSDDQRGRVRYVYNVRHAGETVNHGDRADEYDAIAREEFGTPAPRRDVDAEARERNAAHAARWGVPLDDDTDLYDTGASAERDEQDAADDRNED